MQSGITTAVIAESLARKLFGTATEATGKYVNLNFREYRVCGVVKDVSFAMPNSHALIWIPYTVDPGYNSGWSGNPGSLGDMSAYILASSVKDAGKIKLEAEENIRRYSQTLGEGVEFTTNGQPDLYWQYAFRSWEGFRKNLIWHVVVFFALLLVPAVSLSGMIESRMERRIAEMGVRRAFGAPVNKLMRQVVSENFLFTLSGGLIGLLLSCLIIIFGKDWVFRIGTSMINFNLTAPEGSNIFLAPDMLFNFRIFFIALLVCFMLNLLSSLIPAWRASRRKIVYSLTAKE
jgi:putative ABC transport system permease protein